MMGLFGRRKAADRFPVERLQFLPGGICASIMSEADRIGFDKDRAITSKFACGYMLGYPHYVDQIDHAYGGKIRQLIFDKLFGHDDGRDLFVQSMGFFLAHDDQVRLGWGCGAADGERYFTALDQKRDANGSADSLKMFSQSDMIDFEPQVR
jgi:hypothetical protein